MRLTRSRKVWRTPKGSFRPTTAFLSPMIKTIIGPAIEELEKAVRAKSSVKFTVAIEGARPGHCLLQRRMRMSFDQLLERPYHLIRLAKDRRCATHHGDCAGNIP